MLRWTGKELAGYNMQATPNMQRWERTSLWLEDARQENGVEEGVSECMTWTFWGFCSRQSTVQMIVTVSVRRRRPTRRMHQYGKLTQIARALDEGIEC